MYGIPEIFMCVIDIEPEGEGSSCICFGASPAAIEGMRRRGVLGISVLPRNTYGLVSPRPRDLHLVGTYMPEKHLVHRPAREFSKTPHTSHGEFLRDDSTRLS